VLANALGFLIDGAELDAAHLVLAVHDVPPR
jgi:hypothetical protein